MTHKKQTLLTTLSSTISPDLVTGWKSGIGRKVHGQIVGLPKHRAVFVYVHIEDSGLFSAHADLGWSAVDRLTPEDAVCSAIREWAKHQTFDHLPKSVRALPGVAEDAQEKKRGDIRVRIFEVKERLKYLNRTRDETIVKIDQSNAYLEQLEQTLKTMETV